MDQRCEGIFISPQIKELINNRNFDVVLEGTEETAREAFKILLAAFWQPQSAQLDS
jgi:hypothetical protein